MCRTAATRPWPAAVVSGLPVRVTMPSLTATVNAAGSAMWAPRISSLLTSSRITASGLLYTVSTSERDTMPISAPSSPMTGSRLTRLLYISRAAWLTGSSGPMVTAGLLISSPAVSPATRDRSR